MGRPVEVSVVSFWRSGSVAEAVVRRAELRAALDHVAREALTRSSRGAQHALRSAWVDEKSSLVHSQVFPVMSYSPVAVGTKLPTGLVPSNPSALRFCQGNSLCQLFAPKGGLALSSAP
jgi:hypothetical protein